MHTSLLVTLHSMNDSGLHKGNMSRLESFLEQTPQVVRLDRSDPPSSFLGAKRYLLFILDRLLPWQCFVSEYDSPVKIKTLTT